MRKCTNTIIQTDCCFFFFNDTATTEIYTLSLHALFRSHPGLPPSAPFRPDEEVLHLDLYDRLEPGQERAPQPQSQPARPVPDDQKTLGGRPPAAPVRGRDRSEERRVGKEGRSRWSPYH